MKKILLVFNGETYNSHLVDFATRFCKQVNAALQAAFVSPLREQLASYPFPGELPGLAEQIVGVKELNEQHHRLVQSNIELFIEDCKKAHAEYQVISENDISVSELIDLSAFSDLVLCDAKEQYGSYSFKDFAAGVHCPLVVVSEHSALPQRLIICYDESASSVNAAKTFCNLFPNWQHLPVSLVSINPKGDNGSKIDEYLDEWLQQHFTNVKKVSLEGNLQKELTNYIGIGNRDAMVIMGNYHENPMARIFHKSLVNVILEETPASLFLTHD